MKPDEATETARPADLAGQVDRRVGRTEITHKQAVQRMALWLRNSRGCAVVVTERSVTAVSEQPDVIGWQSNGLSVLIECKISRADFHADRNKYFRHYEDMGVGQQRYFAAPKGLLTAEEMPDGWGLLEIGDHQVRIRKEATGKEPNKKAEVCMLVSAIRRLELAATVFVRHEDETPSDLFT
jgi:hypothetical protein